MKLQYIAHGLAVLMLIAGAGQRANARGIYYDEQTGETVTRDGSSAFILDVPMPPAPPLLPPKSIGRHRKTVIIYPRKLRRVEPEPHTYRP